jgi:hypothetical protein
MGQLSFLVVVLVAGAAASLSELSWIAIGSGVVEAKTGVDGKGGFVTHAGYGTNLTYSIDWANALWKSGHLRNVSYVWAVAGPTDVFYHKQDVNTSSLAKRMVALVEGSHLDRVAVAAHSSGSFVAHALFHNLFDDDSFDPAHVMRERITYYNLDGGIGCDDGAQAGPWICINATVAKGLRVVQATWAKGPNGLWSLNLESMQTLSKMFPNSRGFEIDATHTGCEKTMCVHMVQIEALPWNKTGGNYWDYAGPYDAQHPVQTAYF